MACLYLHCYADDMQFYILTDSSHRLPPPTLFQCLSDVKICCLKMFCGSNNKSKNVLITSSATLKNAKHPSVTTSDFITSTSAGSLCIILLFESHIWNATKPAFFHLKNISRLYSSIQTLQLGPAFVTFRLDQHNTILYRISVQDLCDVWSLATTLTRPHQ